ncbi:cytochrome c oxidase accessory protein CcoG [Sandaracinomonas limnophila]|uniref:Cytochrome c oxidase accessory protein CcoG n=1 Tax=Sandaracinomonas limnophila TaxID=1862386 RepID=A0A437PWD1_9BACT|nr:cytochrome c oxidase accessory protein CcoG [Sandaracinomonas limnophila]RVU26575.1 cytochrome c oxidase accessory protein CcoG [Sandaracinomonas limnophila]
MSAQFNLENEDFRNHLYNQSKDGKRLWIYPGRIIGKLYKARTVFSWVLLILLFGLPWLQYQGHPLFMFNVIERQFIFFGVPFFPQDFHLVALGLVSFLIFISLFTVLFGRIWCGWACPQTIFMEMLFRKIEYLIEGDDKAQRRLAESPWTTEKIVKKSSKHLIFFIISFAIANTFLMYIMGNPEWLKMVTEPPIQHLKGLGLILIFTGVFYFVFARFREMVCMVVCPYGRLQGVLLDNNSINVQYDTVRGEPRGKIQKNSEAPKTGDCIDCHWCVRVCPTGIDIRNGSNQLECIGCTACIDACDEVMDKIHKPKGLIRYDSLNGVLKGEKLKFNKRIGAYSLVLVLLLGFISYLLITRKPWEGTILRTPGMTFQSNEKTHEISNMYQIEILNKSFQDEQFEIVPDKPFELVWIGNPVNQVEKGKLIKGNFFLKIKEGNWQRGKKVYIEIKNKNGQSERLKSSFIAP